MRRASPTPLADSMPLLALVLLAPLLGFARAQLQGAEPAAACLVEARNVTIEQTQPWQWHRSLQVVGTASPRLGWQVGLTAAAPPGTKDQSQSGYRITATDPATGKTLWDSGEVASAETLGIAWGGAPLTSRQRVEVTVTIRDHSGRACAPSAKVGFETGLLRTTDWKAEWIGPPVPRNASDTCGMFADDPAPVFRKAFATKSGPRVVKARLYGTGLGYYRLFVNGERVGDGALEPAWTAFAKRVFYSSYDVTEMLTKRGNAGSHVLAAELGKGWWDPLPLLFWGHDNWRDGLATGTVSLIVSPATAGPSLVVFRRLTPTAAANRHSSK